MTLSEGMRELMHFRNVASEFPCFEVPDEIDVRCDNNSTIFVSENLVNNSRSKHIDIRYHYVRELIERKIIKLSHICTKLNIADIMTKPLTSDVFVKFANWMLGR